MWLWCRLAVAAPIRPLAQELPCATGMAIKRKNKQKSIILFTLHRSNLSWVSSQVFVHFWLLYFFFDKSLQLFPSFQNILVFEIDWQIWPDYICNRLFSFSASLFLSFFLKKNSFVLNFVNTWLILGKVLCLEINVDDFEDLLCKNLSLYRENNIIVWWTSVYPVLTFTCYQLMANLVSINTQLFWSTYQTSWHFITNYIFF